MIRKQNELLQFLGFDFIEEVEEDTTEQLEETTEELCDEYYGVMETEEALDDNALFVNVESSEEIEECEVTDEDVVESIVNEPIEDHIEPKSEEIYFAIVDDKKNPKQKVPRLEEVKFEEIKPHLILTPNFLKARDALKRLPSEAYKDSKANSFLTATIVSNDNKKLVYICSDSKCKEIFSSEDEWKLHLNDHAKFYPTPVQCEDCAITFKSQQSYEKHCNSVHNGPQCTAFVCQVCGKELQTRVQWRSHLRNHDQSLKYKCNYEGCKKAFRVKHHLINHLRSHTKESPFRCTFEGCSSAFRQKHALTIHLRKHTLDFIACDHCKSPFVTQFQLKKHLDKCNGVYRPLMSRATPKSKTERPPSDSFKCPIGDCGESFKAKISLEKHLTKVHRLEVTPTLCVLCCQNFETSQALKSHMRDHLPFSCMLCSVNFKNEDNLNNHILKSHDKNEVRLHNCHHCTASFKRADHLRTHIAYKHNESRPYACDSCSYMSPTRSDLNSHMKTHIKEKNLLKPRVQL